MHYRQDPLTHPRGNPVYHSALGPIPSDARVQIHFRSPDLSLALDLYEGLPGSLLLARPPLDWHDQDRRDLVDLARDHTGATTQIESFRRGLQVLLQERVDAWGRSASARPFRDRVGELLEDIPLAEDTTAWTRLHETECW